MFDPPVGPNKNYTSDASTGIEYTIPKDIHFWYQQERSTTGVSESRREFLKEINNADSGFKIPDVLGFNAEYSRTFNESHNVETCKSILDYLLLKMLYMPTDKKYAASYISYTAYSWGEYR